MQRNPLIYYYSQTLEWMDLLQFEDHATIAKHLRSLPAEISEDGTMARFTKRMNWDDEGWYYVEGDKIQEHLQDQSEILEQEVYKKYRFVKTRPQKTTRDITRHNYLEMIDAPRFKIMAKQEWNKRTLEYFSLQKPAAETKRDLVYESGLICRLHNIRAETSPKAIKKLLSLMGRVMYIEMEVKVYVRFASADDARNAVQYLSTVYIDGDCWTMKPTRSRRHREAVKNDWSNTNGIICELLQGKEEQAYWQWIHECQASQQPDTTNVDAHATVFIETDLQEQKRMVRKHTLFDSDDEDPKRQRISEI
ncbi:hypothetical protein EDD86DRAFT_209846 [Gorgonomyces haynaldii]|nr:hypothetical protein EDD86DRAFT_209846 [Gorgonomyces haynaldii]